MFAYISGDLIAKEIIGKFSKYIARGIHNIVCLLDPDKLIVGGGVINHHINLIQRILGELDILLIPEQKQILNRMHASKLKEDAGLIGAGLRVFEK
jgi:glucokinase